MAKNDMNKLTASYVAGLKKYVGKDLPEDMRTSFPDGGGLFLKYDRKAKRFYWVFKFNYPKGRGNEKRAGYGTFPNVTLAQARERRDADRLLLSQGINPIEKRKADAEEQRAKSLTYEKIARQWHEQTTDNPKNHKATIQRLEKHVFPAIGNKPYVDVTRQDLADILAGVAQEKNERTQTGKIYTAHKLSSYLSQIDDYGEARGLIENNRALRLTRALPSPPKNGGFPAVTDIPGIRAMLQAIASYYAGTKGSPYMRAALRLLPYMGFRPSLLAGAKWEELDLDAGLMKVNAEMQRTKWTHGAKVFPLSRQAISILKGMEELRAESPYVFPSHAKRGFLTIEGIGAAHDKNIISHDKHVPHSWRKVFSTLCRDHGAPYILTEISLAHTTGGKVELVYNKAQYVEPRRMLIQWFADALDAIEKEMPLPAMPVFDGFTAYE